MMGYRTYIGIMSKAKADKIKGYNTFEKALDELQKDIDEGEDPYIPGPYKMCDKTLTEVNVDKESNFIEKYCTPLLTYPEAKKNYYCDYSFHEMSLEGLKEIVKFYMTKASDYYGSLHASLTTVGADTIDLERFLNRRSVDWQTDKALAAVDYSQNKLKLTNSWDYEYNAFQLAMFLKHIDTQENILVYYGY
jgi:hypothetical protein